MDVKFGKIKPQNNIFLASIASTSDENFFSQNSKTKQEEKKQKSSSSGSRMNDLDSNILENNAYQELPDEMFKIEHRMGLLEENISKLANEIETLESLGYDIQVNNLKSRKEKMEKELALLNEDYSKLGLSSKISGQIASAMSFTSNKKINIFSKAKRFVSKKILARLSKRFNFSETMKDALDNLSNINFSVDELIKMKSPYGETVKRYEKLTAYLNKANLIHSQISRNINDITKKAQ